MRSLRTCGGRHSLGFLLISICQYPEVASIVGYCFVSPSEWTHRFILSSVVDSATFTVYHFWWSTQNLSEPFRLRASTGSMSNLGVTGSLTFSRSIQTSLVGESFLFLHSALNGALYTGRTFSPVRPLQRFALKIILNFPSYVCSKVSKMPRNSMWHCSYFMLNSTLRSRSVWRRFSSGF